MPYPPGGGTDGLGRITCQFLSEKLGQPIVVQNIGGASGTLGSETVRRADPDGYTLLFNASLFVLGKTVMPTCPYDPADRLPGDRPGRRGAAGAVCATTTCRAPTTPAPWRRSRRSRRSTSSPCRPAARPATSPRSAFLKRTGLPLDTILYKGTAPANADLVAGNVQLFMDPWTALAAARHLRPGARPVRHLQGAHASLRPTSRPSDEVGLKDFNISSWYGLWAPKDTPDPIVDKLASAMAEVSKDPGFIAKTTSLGIVPTARGPKEFAAFIKTEVEMNTALSEGVGVQAGVV